MDVSFRVDVNGVEVHFDGLSLDLHNTYDLVALERPDWSTLTLRWHPNQWAGRGSQEVVVLTVEGVRWLLDVPGDREEDHDCLGVIGFLHESVELSTRSSFSGRQWTPGDHFVLAFENGRWLRMLADRAYLIAR